MKTWTVAIYDGPHYLGMVTAALHGGFYAQQSGRSYATLPTKEDAAEWRICEHRDTPWADRPEAQRIAPNARA